MAELMRLRIPSSWVVHFNNFYDVDAEYDSEGKITNWHLGFSEDMFWMREMKGMNSTSDALVPDCFEIEISWQKVNYVVTLSFSDSEQVFCVEWMESKDRYVIRDKMEAWLKHIDENYRTYIEEVKTQLGIN